MTNASHKSDTIMKHIAEYDYIVSIDYRNPGSNFNHDTACFKRYVVMQGNAAIKDGVTQVGNDLLKFAEAF
jgi:hypothetical protein